MVWKIKGTILVIVSAITVFWHILAAVDLEVCTRVSIYNYHGIGAVSIDGGTETDINFYSANKTGDVLLWTSPVLPYGTYTFKLRVTGTHDSASTGTVVVVDRAEILTSS